MAWTDVTIIRSHLIIRGFVEDYTVWIHHGETVIVNDEDEEEYDDETIEFLSQYSAELDAQMDFEFGNEQGGDAGGWDGNDEGGARVGDEDDLEDMIRALGPEILLNGPKGLENFKRVKKASKEAVYGVEKGCPTHCTLLRFMLELLFLKAKYGWSDCSFNDLLHLLSWVLPQPNSVPATHTK